ncbi:putative membrane-tethered transcription factor (SPT23) [Aspergillus undulatus]|uniref:putative membrane-tethered transcription factor (SPT23) n=1 Tax=Aspergillus undulatus TaxID=1810928 RepID=UPI003CCDE817
MGSASSPTFPALEPIVVDEDMVNPYQDTKMGFLDPAGLQFSSENAGQEFDDLFSRASSSRTVADSNPPCLSPSELSLKRSYTDHESLRHRQTFTSDSSAESPEDSSPSSSSESPRNHLRNSSVASSASAVYSENTVMPFGYTSEDWVNPEYDHPKEESLFGFDASLPNLEGPYPAETDLESSNKAMDAAFDFESAASSPSPLKTGSTPLPRIQKGSRPRMRGGSAKRQSASPRIAQTSFLPHNTKDAPTPFQPSSMSQVKSPLLEVKPPLSPWGEQSPTSYLEDSFGGINMNGVPQSRPGIKFPPQLPFGFGFVSPAAQKTMNVDTPQYPTLTVHPTSLKSRVETQIPIKLTLHPLPQGVKKLRLPSHTISKPKFLAPPAPERSADTVELYTSLFCTSALQDKEKLKKALAKARGDSTHRSSSASPMATDEAQEEDRPLDGGEVKICAGCIQRERKRAFRKKQRKPEEDELFQKHEDKRVIVFNTHEIKDWVEPSKNATSSELQGPAMFPGAMQVELPMRIACYCRHQNEKIGFQVIFTLKDYKDNVIAQAITNSIMITDDHKTHAPQGPPAPGPAPALPDGTELPGVGVFPSGPSFDAGKSPASAKQAIGSPSATDLQGLQQRFNPQFQPASGAFVNPTNGGTSSNSQGSRSLSRQASPNDFQGPTSKRRKHSNSGRLPSELTMTKLENGQSSTRAPSNEPQFPAPRGFASPSERPFVTSTAMSNHFGNGPLTPTSGDTNPFFTSLQQQNLENFIQQQLMSAPNSAQPSRPGTPGGSGRNSFQDQNLNLSLGPTPSTPMWPGITNAGNRLPTVIHKLVPAEGSVTGGTEVTLLGSGFYPGMEVVFGDTLATTTTFWGDKCLNCLTPPALQPGQVPVVFKHEHPSFNQLQQQPQPLIPKQQQYFRYVDDRELQMYRLALGILGHKLGNQADAFHTAQQIMGSDYKGAFNLQKDFQGSSSGHQRQVPGLESQGKLGDMDSKMLTYLEFIDLDDSPRPPKFNTRCATGQTLLHFASSLGLTRFVAGLLARGAHPDVQDNTGNTPMHLAALNGHAHIVHRLRLAGSDPNVRSVRGFTPADIASTLPAHQAALIPARHYRSRSVGSLTSRRRQSSSASLHSLWETSSMSGSFDQAVDDSETDDDDEELILTTSRRSSVHHDAPAPLTREPTASEDDARPFSPPAALVAWRNQLQAQINQFQQSVTNAFPNLPNLPALPPMPALPGYQGNPMMRRITNLVPHRPAYSRGTGAKEGWWDMLTGNSAPNSPSSPGTTDLPSYDDLYPRKETGDEEEAARAEKASMLQAAAEAALDQHFEAQASSSRNTGEQEREDIKDIRIGRHVISKEQQKRLREQQARSMKSLGSDRNLYFFWIPILILVIFAYARSYVPGVSQAFSEAYEFVKSRSTQRLLDIGA